MWSVSISISDGAKKFPVRSTWYRVHQTAVSILGGPPGTSHSKRYGVELGAPSTACPGPVSTQLTAATAPRYKGIPISTPCKSRSSAIITRLPYRTQLLSSAPNASAWSFAGSSFPVIASFSATHLFYFFPSPILSQSIVILTIQWANAVAALSPATTLVTRDPPKSPRRSTRRHPPPVVKLTLTPTATLFGRCDNCPRLLWPLDLRADTMTLAVQQETHRRLQVQRQDICQCERVLRRQVRRDEAGQEGEFPRCLNRQNLLGCTS